jgi:hypothetical protein
MKDTSSYALKRFIDKCFKPFCLTLIFTLCLLATAGNGQSSNVAPEGVSGSETILKGPGIGIDPDIVTVAAIRKSADGKTVKVLFNEKAQIFIIKTEEKNANESIKSLEGAFKSGLPVKLSADHARSVIKSLAKPSAKEVESFQSIRKLMVKAEKPLAFDVKKIDIDIFDDIENLKFPVWRLCCNIVPDFTTAKKIFDYCAKQSCNLPGPYDISPCIPFQYVRDGCYARAHKMKWIISSKFGYCSEKVFSFANQNNEELSVVASKWGGCCVNWWYHVAPVIRVKVPVICNKRVFMVVKAYVIDPGMFDEPVLLSTWLTAQENAACSANANVSMYTIQPSSAYTPANYAGTAFSTDPSYVSTDNTLNAYKNLLTCP